MKCQFFTLFKELIKNYYSLKMYYIVNFDMLFYHHWLIKIFFIDFMRMMVNSEIMDPSFSKSHFPFFDHHHISKVINLIFFIMSGSSTQLIQDCCKTSKNCCFQLKSKLNCQKVETGVFSHKSLVLFWHLYLVGENHTYRKLFHCIYGGRVPKSYLKVKLH